MGTVFTSIADAALRSTADETCLLALIALRATTATSSAESAWGPRDRISAARL